MDSAVTIQRHILERQKLHPEASGGFTRLLWDLTIACKIISKEVNRAGLAQILGETEETNVHGEDVMKLDRFAQNTITTIMKRGGHLCVMGSEEEPEPIPIPDGLPLGPYVLLFDPLDGSSNIDVNVSVGTIWAIYRRKSPPGRPGGLEDLLQPGSQLAAAGYLVYGSSTMLVYSTGSGVSGFTLDPSLGEFLLSHEDIRVPERGRIYSINEGHSYGWDEGTQAYVDYIKTPDAERGLPYTARYIGSMVSDVHRTLLKGGIFCYPSIHKNGKVKNKLRLLYEANPMGFLIEQAGGLASTGTEPILDIQPQQLHQRVPVAMGSRKDVEDYMRFMTSGKRPEEYGG